MFTKSFGFTSELPEAAKRRQRIAQGLRPGLLLLRRFAASATSPCRRFAASTATVLSIARWRLGPTRP